MVKYGKTEKLSTEEHRGSSSSSSNSSASSSSDSEYYSPEEIIGKKAKHHKVRRSPKLKHSKVKKLMMSESDVTVEGDSASTSTENNIPIRLDTAEYNAAMEKIQQLEKVVSDMNHERQQLFRTLMDEVKGFFGEDKNFSDTGAQEVDFFCMVKEVKKEATTVKFQLESAEKENQEMKKYIEECNSNMTRLAEENGTLRLRTGELENLPRPRCESCDTSKVIYEDTKALQSRIEEMVKQVGDLQCQNEKLEEEVMASKNDKEARDALQSRLEENVRDLKRQNEKLEEELIASKNDKEAREKLESRLEEMVAKVSDLQRQNEKLEEEVTVSKNDKEARHMLEARVEGLVKEVSDLENRNKEMKDKIISFEGIHEAKNVLESRVEDQVDQIGDLRSENKKLEEEISSSNMEKERLMDQMAAMQQEMESDLHRKKRELTEQINTIQVERLNDERSRTRDDERRVLESEEMVKNLEMQIDSSNKQKSEMEVILKETSEENCQLKEKSKELENKIYDSERTLVQRNERVSELDRETSELSTKLALRDEEFNTLKSQKSQLELKIARDREDKALGMKNNNSSAKEREERVNNGLSSKEFEKIKGWFKGSKPSLQVIERKMEELVEEFRKHMEDNIRLMSQRIRVTEQLHVENKENYKITKERLEQENRTLEARTFEYSRILSTLDAGTTRLKNVAEATHNMLSGLDLVCKQFDERSGRMMNRMSKLSEELRYVKNWVVGTKKVNELLKGEMGGLVEQLQRKEGNEGMLREKISTLLEGKVENVSLVKGLEQVEQKMKGLEGMVKDKENDILDICEEKREAIRQLCVLIDYQKNRSDHFKQIIIEKCNVVSPRKC